MDGRILKVLDIAARKAIADALGLDAEPDVRETQDGRFGDYQINGILPLAKVARDNPRKLAAQVVEVLDTSGMCLAPEIAGPGFINLRLDPAWLASYMGRAAADSRLLVGPTDVPQTIIVDFSSPNVAKRMHAGHLRSTCIGDAIVRTLRFNGHRVIGDNHVGDWGTQFGTLLWAWEHARDEEALEADPVGELERLYKFGSEASRADEAVAESCRAELALLQAGDPERKALWERFVAISRQDAESTYSRMNVSFDTWFGESHYHDALEPVVDELMTRGLARESEGALAVFFEDHPKLGETPFLIRKRDGAFLYATTDLATVLFRLKEYEADRLVYVVDVRQSLHFEQLFETVRRMGHAVRCEHVGFGMMLGSDGRPFRTRDGGTVSLKAVLDEAEARILPKVEDKWPDVAESEQREIAASVGVGAVKYADLSPNLTTDYRFEWDKLLSADGNTGPYLQYTRVRILSVLRGFEREQGEPYVVSGEPLRLDSQEALDLARQLLKLGDVTERVGRHLRPHILCEHLYSVARAFNLFYAKHRVLGIDDAALQRSRLSLCRAAATTFDIGFECLNLPALDRM